MDSLHLPALVDVAHHTLRRVGQRVDAVFVAFHGAHVAVHGELARCGLRGVRDEKLAIELPVLGLGRFLGTRLLAWMIEEPIANATPPLDQLHHLLLASPNAGELFANMSPLEWQDRAHGAIAAAHALLDGLVRIAEPVAAAEIVEMFCVHGAASVASGDDLHARCSGVLWRRWLSDSGLSLADLEHRHPRLFATIPRMIAA